MKIPPSEQVAAAWLNSLPDLDAPAATSLPAGTAWATTGFVVVEVVGSGAIPDVPSRVPIIRCHTWAVVPGSSQTPYGHASGIAEIIRSYAWEVEPVTLTIRSQRVRVQSGWPLSELTRIPDPDASRAHYVVDIGLRWVALPN